MFDVTTELDTVPMGDLREKIAAAATVPLQEVARKYRRAAVRYTCPAVNTAQVFGAEAKWMSAWLHDLSKLGVGLLLGQPVQPATELDIVLFTGAIARVTVRARVVHASARNDGCWVVGCAFLQPLSREELAALL